MKLPKKVWTIDDATPEELRSVRRTLASCTSLWREVHTLDAPDGTTQILGAYFRPLVLDWAALEKRLSPEDYELVRKLFRALRLQAMYARIFEPVAGYELRGTHRKRSRGGKESAVTRRGPTSKAAKVRDEIAKHVDAGRDPWTLVPRIAKRAGCSEVYVRQIMRAAEKRN